MSLKSRSQRPTPQKVLEALATGDHYAVRAVLTPRQVRFCEEYCVDFNATQAARRAGYTGSPQQSSANLMLNDGIKFLINEISKERAESVVSVDPEYIVREIVKITEKPGTSDANRLRGLELLAKHLGMFIERREISGPDGDAIKLKQVHDELADFTSKLRRISERSGETRVVTLAEPGDEGSP